MYRLIAFAAITLFTSVNIVLFSFKEDLLDFQTIQLITAKGAVPLLVELAETPEEQQMGLMYREELQEGKGMLFVYSQPEKAVFWMKNMLIPLDILFIGSDLKIKQIFARVSPCLQNASCPTLSFSYPIQYVLEVPEGFTQRHQIQKGDQLILPESL